MKELAFPIAAIALTFLVLMPVLSVLSRLLLTMRRHQTRHWVSYGRDATLAILLAPTILPLAWLVSSALHQTEPAQALEACLLDHPAWVTACVEIFMLLGMLAAAIGLAVIIKMRKTRLQLGELVPCDDPTLSRKLSELIAGSPTLCAFEILIAEGAPAAVFTFGWWRPRVGIDACFLRDNDPEILRAAILHEFAHARDRDPLRVFIARICLLLNPAGSLLAADFERWQHAREAICDAEAVHAGGDALSLAQGIVRAARFSCASAYPAASAIARLSGLAHRPRAALLKLRVALLLDGPAAPQPRTLRHQASALLFLALCLIAIAMPHLRESGGLEVFHLAVERFLFGLAG